MTLWLLAFVLLAGLTGGLALMGPDRRRAPARETYLRGIRRRFASGEISFDEYRRRVVEQATSIYGPRSLPGSDGHDRSDR